MKRIQPYLICFLFTLTILFIHRHRNSDSYLNDPDLKNTVAFHATIQHPAFAKRPLTTFLVKTVSTISSLSIGKSFVLVAFSFLFLSGILLFKLSERLNRNIRISTINIFVYNLCFSNLFAFFQPVYSYDEPVQFCLIFLSFIFYLDREWIFFIITFTLSIIARESSILLISGLFILFPTNKNNPSNELFQKALVLIIPIILYGMFLSVYIHLLNIVDTSKHDITNRFSHFYGNFRDKTYTIESLTSFVLITIIPIYLLVIQLWNKTEKATLHVKHIKAFVITLVINSLVVFSTTKAREVRLFVIPLFFIWPIFGDLFQNEIKLLSNPSNVIKTILRWPYFAYFVLLNSINYYFSFNIYKTTIGTGGENYFNYYLFISLLFISIHFILTVNNYQKSRINA